MAMLLDAGALIAYERGAPVMRALLARAHDDETPVSYTHLTLPTSDLV